MALCLVSHQNFRFFGDRKTYLAPGLLTLDRIHLSQREKRVLSRELAGLIDWTLSTIRGGRGISSG